MAQNPEFSADNFWTECHISGLKRPNWSLGPDLSKTCSHLGIRHPEAEKFASDRKWVVAVWQNGPAKFARAKQRCHKSVQPQTSVQDLHLVPKVHSCPRGLTNEWVEVSLEHPELGPILDLCKKHQDFLHAVFVWENFQLWPLISPPKHKIFPNHDMGTSMAPQSLKKLITLVGGAPPQHASRNARKTTFWVIALTLSIIYRSLVVSKIRYRMPDMCIPKKVYYHVGIMGFGPVEVWPLTNVCKKQKLRGMISPPSDRLMPWYCTGR